MGVSQIFSRYAAPKPGQKERKVKSPSVETLLRIAHEFHTSVDWLLTGREPKAQVESPEIVFESHEDGRIRPRVDLQDQYVAVPLLADAVAAGLPAQVDESQVKNWAIIYNDKHWVPHAPENYTCCHVRGRSMFPILDSGDIVAIDHAERPKSLADLKKLDGHICAFRVDGGVTIKWLKYVPEKNSVIGMPENKEELDTTIILTGKEINDGILGLVRWWWSKR